MNGTEIEAVAKVFADRDQQVLLAVSALARALIKTGAIDKKILVEEIDALQGSLAPTDAPRELLDVFCRLVIAAPHP